MKEVKTIFISNFHPFVSRNLFDSTAVAKIAEHTEQVIVFVLKHKEAYLKEKYEKEGIMIVGVELGDVVKRRTETLESRIAEIFLDTHTKHLHQRLYYEETRHFVKYLFSRFFMKTLAHCKVLKRLFRWWILCWNNTSTFDEYFKQYKPEITVSTDPFSPFDSIFMKNARKTNTKLVGLIRSWDNFTTKEYLHVKPDKVVVQNEDMVREGTELHDLEEFTVVGVPQFEYYKRYSPTSREAFCTHMGLDSTKRIVLFSPAGERFSSTDWQICEILKREQEMGNLPNDLQFLVRLHPMNKADLSQFVPNEHFVIDDPNSSYMGDRAKESEMGIESVNHLANSLFHSVVVLNSVSSLIIDAAIFDKPVITISFDGWEHDVPMTRSVLTEQANEWLQVLLDKGLSPRANTVEELVRYMNEYLSNPQKDAEKREHFVNEHCYKLDGKAAERIAAAVFTSCNS